MINREIIIIGAGPAGMAAAVKMNELGFRDVLILEKEDSPGGVLRQCIHPGFGLIRFGKNLTGPEYSQEYERRLKESAAEVQYETTVLGIREGESGRVCITAAGPEGTEEYRCDAAILASGCREKSRGELMIPGDRPAGIYTAGTAQGMMNLLNARIGEKIVIIGSGDIGDPGSRHERLLCRARVYRSWGALLGSIREGNHSGTHPRSQQISCDQQHYQ